MHRSKKIRVPMGGVINTMVGAPVFRPAARMVECVRRPVPMIKSGEGMLCGIDNLPHIAWSHEAWYVCVESVIA